MTASNKKNVQYLVGLLVIAGLTWFLVYRTGAISSSANVKKPASNKHSAAKPLKDPTIHSEFIQSADAGDDVGRKNIFQYRQKPLPPAPPTIRPNPVPVTPIPTPQPYTPPPPAPPVMKTWKYDGYSVSGPPKTGKQMASLTDGAATYQVALGECLMGQYCVRQINEREVEIEDTVLKLRRTFPKTPSQQ